MSSQNVVTTRWMSLVCLLVSCLVGSAVMAQAQGLVLPARGQVTPVRTASTARAVTSLKPAEVGDLLLQSHVVFAESWRLMQLQNGTSTNSIFKAISQHFVKETSAPVCPKSGFSWQVEQKTTSMSIALKPCVKNKNLASVTATAPAAVFSWQAPMHSFEFTADTEQFRDVVGDSLAMLNPQLQCKGHWGKDFLLVDLNCKNLGLGLQRSTHVLYQTFNYNSVAQNTDATMLLVEADQYMNLVSRQLCDSSEPCLRLRVPGRGKIAWRKDLRHVVLATNSRPTPNLAPVATTVPVRKAQAAVDPNINPNSDFYDHSYAQDLPQTDKASQASQAAAQKMVQSAQAQDPSQGQVQGQGRIVQDVSNLNAAQNQVANSGEQNVQLAGNENPEHLSPNMQNGPSNEIQNNQAGVQSANETQDGSQNETQSGSQDTVDPQEVASLEQGKGQGLQISDVGSQTQAGGGQQREIQSAQQPEAHPVTGPDSVPQGGVHIR